MKSNKDFVVLICIVMLSLTGCQYSNDAVMKDEVFQKQILREGDTYVVNMTRHPTEYGYTITYETDRFTLEKGNNYERLVGEGKDTYLSIDVLPGRSKKEITDIIEQQYSVISGGSVLIDNIEATAYEMLNDDITKKIYVLERNNTVYVITSSYLSEGEEGYGACMNDAVCSIEFHEK